MWDLMEAEDFARPPRPVHHRIPNFDGAEAAAARLAALPEFRAASLVKVNPDTPQKPVRLAVLNSGKRLLTPQPRLRTGEVSRRARARRGGVLFQEDGGWCACARWSSTHLDARAQSINRMQPLTNHQTTYQTTHQTNKKGFFSILDADALPPGALQKAVTAAGVAEFGAPVDLEATRGLKVDLLGAPPPRCRAPSPPCLFAAALPLSPRLLSPLPSPLSHSAPASPSPAPPLHLDIKKNSRRLQLRLAQRRALGQGRGLC